VDGLDAERARLARAADLDAAAVERQLARVGLEDAGDDLDQRRLAGAVVADDRVHLAVAELEIRLAQRDHAAEMLGDCARLEQRGRGLRHRCLTSLSSRSPEYGLRPRGCQGMMRATFVIGAPSSSGRSQSDV